MKCQGFYDSVLNVQGVPDRPYTAKDFCMHLKGMIGNGIGITNATGDDAWKVEKTDDLQVKITLGDNNYNYASLNGNPFSVDEELKLDFSIGADRWDAVIIRANGTSSVRATDVIVQEGSIELTRTDDIYDLRLARVHIVNNEISEIIDDRLDYNVCGIANGLATVPVDKLLEVLEAAKSGQLVALKDGTKQVNLNAEMVGGVKGPTLLANAKYHIPTYSNANPLPVDDENCMPTMNSNNQSGFVITHNLATTDYMEPYLLFSENYADRSTNSEATNKYAYLNGTAKKVTLELPYWAKITKCKYYSQRSGNDTTTIYLQASKDGENWVTIGSGNAYASFSEREMTISDIYDDYYKYIRFYSSGAYLKKINFDITYISSFDVNRLDLAFGFDSLVAGQKFGITIPSGYVQDLKGKMQIDNFGYKDLPKNLKPGNNYCLMYNGEQFVPVEIPIVGKYIGDGIDGREIDLGFPIKRIYIHRLNGVSPTTTCSLDSGVITPEYSYYSGVSIDGSKIKLERVSLPSGTFGANACPLNESNTDYIYEAYA